MKKNVLWITIIIACLLVGAACASEATAVPSPTLSVAVTQVTAKEEGKVVSETFVLREVELETVEQEKVAEILPPATAELYVKLQEVKTAEPAAEETAAKPVLSVIIPEEKMVTIVEKLPAETVVENLVVAEFIREKILRSFRDEVPHSIGVAVEQLEYDRRKDLHRVFATIYVERDGQKGIIIGKKGAAIKQIGQEARNDLEQLLGTRVFLELNVKVKKNWRRDSTQIRRFGYGE